eukprot:GILJ01011257.1.p1 GENE.GILJ01011257.1~~GILJ01011257.1.p1  ORF type:complete len:1159 (-),score=176.82 GILJ01011257.1:239-3649(-)
MSQSDAAFLDAARDGNAPMIKELSLSVSNVNCIDALGNSALHLASIVGDIDSVRCLISLGAKPNLPNFTQNTPMHFACERGHVKVVLALLLAGGSLKDNKNTLSKTPLDVAAKQIRKLVTDLPKESDPAYRSLLTAYAKPFVEESNNDKGKQSPTLPSLKKKKTKKSAKGSLTSDTPSASPRPKLELKEVLPSSTRRGSMVSSTARVSDYAAFQHQTEKEQSLAMVRLMEQWQSLLAQQWTFDEDYMLINEVKTKEPPQVDLIKRYTREQFRKPDIFTKKDLSNDLLPTRLQQLKDKQNALHVKYQLMKEGIVSHLLELEDTPAQQRIKLMEKQRKLIWKWRRKLLEEEERKERDCLQDGIFYADAEFLEKLRVHRTAKPSVKRGHKPNVDVVLIRGDGVESTVPVNAANIAEQSILLRQMLDNPEVNAEGRKQLFLSEKAKPYSEFELFGSFDEQHFQRFAQFCETPEILDEMEALQSTREVVERWQAARKHVLLELMEKERSERVAQLQSIWESQYSLATAGLENLFQEKVAQLKREYDAAVERQTETLRYQLSDIQKQLQRFHENEELKLMKLLQAMEAEEKKHIAEHHQEHEKKVAQIFPSDHLAHLLILSETLMADRLKNCCIQLMSNSILEHAFKKELSCKWIEEDTLRELLHRVKLPDLIILDDCRPSGSQRNLSAASELVRKRRNALKIPENVTGGPVFTFTPFLDRELRDRKLLERQKYSRWSNGQLTELLLRGDAVFPDVLEAAISSRPNMKKVEIDTSILQPTVEVSTNHLSLTLTSDKRYVTAHATQPRLSGQTGRWYFEVAVKSLPVVGRFSVAIGLDVPRSDIDICLPGRRRDHVAGKGVSTSSWSRVEPPSSVGIVWQNDGVLHCFGDGMDTGLRYGINDTIGVGVNQDTKVVFFTKNGDLLAKVRARDGSTSSLLSFSQPQSPSRRSELSRGTSLRQLSKLGSIRGNRGFSASQASLSSLTSLTSVPSLSSLHKSVSTRSLSLLLPELENQLSEQKEAQRDGSPPRPFKLPLERVVTAVVDEMMCTVQSPSARAVNYALVQLSTEDSLLDQGFAIQPSDYCLVPAVCMYQDRASDAKARVAVPDPQHEGIYRRSASVTFNFSGPFLYPLRGFQSYGGVVR